MQRKVRRCRKAREGQKQGMKFDYYFIQIEKVIYPINANGWREGLEVFSDEIGNYVKLHGEEIRIVWM